MASKVWEKQPNESSKAYAAFCIYRDMGISRSLQKVSQQLSKSETLMKRWSERWSWVDRASGYDDYIERRKREENEKTIIEMSERHAKLAVAFQQRLAQRLASLDPSEITPGDMVRWLDIATKIERLSRGEPTEIGKQEVQATWADLVKAMREKG